MLITLVGWEVLNPPSLNGSKHAWYANPSTFTIDPDIYDLSSDTKIVLLALKGIACQKNSATFRANEQIISVMANVRVEIVADSLLALESRGVIKCQQERQEQEQLPTSSAVIPTLRQTDRQTDRQESPDKPDLAANAAALSSLAETDCQEEKLTPSQLVTIWNAHRGSLPAAQRVTSQRRVKASTRIKESAEPDYWIGIVRRLAASSFATGGNGRTWRATFDWLIENDTNHVKVSEGKYDDRITGTAKPAERIARLEDIA